MTFVLECMYELNLSGMLARIIFQLGVEFFCFVLLYDPLMQRTIACHKDSQRVKWFSLTEPENEDEREKGEDTCTRSIQTCRRPLVWIPRGPSRIILIKSYQIIAATCVACLSILSSFTVLISHFQIFSFVYFHRDFFRKYLKKSNGSFC